MTKLEPKKIGGKYSEGVRSRKGRQPQVVWAVLWTTYDDEAIEAIYMNYRDADEHCERENAKQSWGNVTPDYWAERHTLSVDTLSSYKLADDVSGAKG